MRLPIIFGILASAILLFAPPETSSALGIGGVQLSVGGGILGGGVGGLGGGAGSSGGGAASGGAGGVGAGVNGGIAVGGPVGVGLGHAGGGGTVTGVATGSSNAIGTAIAAGGTAVGASGGAPGGSVNEMPTFQFHGLPTLPNGHVKVPNASEVVISTISNPEMEPGAPAANTPGDGSAEHVLAPPSTSKPEVGPKPAVSSPVSRGSTAVRSSRAVFSHRLTHTRSRISSASARSRNLWISAIGDKLPTMTILRAPD